MKEVISSNWNQNYGNKEKISILNKTINFNNVPINQDYVFFKNGAYRNENIDEKMIPKEVKDILEKEYRNSKSTSFGPGTIRPMPFNEFDMSNLYYDNSSIKSSVSNIMFNSISPLAVADLFFGGADSLTALLAATTISEKYSNILADTYNSAGNIDLPKIGKSKMFFNKKSPLEKEHLIGSVNRNYPIINEENKSVYKKNITNLSDDKFFQSSMGTKEDTLMSSAELNGGSAFSSITFVNRKKTDYMKNLDKNSDKKYELMKNFVKNTSNYQDAEKNSNNLIIKFFNKFLQDAFNVNIFIDFTDYLVAPRAIIAGSALPNGGNTGTTTIGNIRVKGYENPKKEKSVFGPYICRSKYIHWFYPTIIFTTRTSVSSPTLLSFTQSMGGVSIFNGKGILPMYAPIVDFNFSALLTMSGLPSLPFCFGDISFITKQISAESSFPKNFPKKNK